VKKGALEAAPEAEGDRRAGVEAAEAGQPRSLDQPRPPEKSPPKESSREGVPREGVSWEESLREESLREESPLKESLLKSDLLRSFLLKEFSIEEFSKQAIPLQRGRFALPPPQDFFCPRLFLPGTFCFRTWRAKEVAGERSRE